MRVRQLYTDLDEVLFNAARPVILNGIEDMVERADLADRAVFLTLDPIPEERRRPEAELWADFEAEHPHILGALLDAVAEGLKRLPETRLPKLPRMADFAKWATACETAIWPAGTFWSAYCSNRNEAVVDVIEADPVATAVRAFMSAQKEWKGTASNLLVALGKVVDEHIAKSKDWPGSSPGGFGGQQLSCVRSGLRSPSRRKAGRGSRIVHITASAPENAGAQPSAQSAQPASESNLTNVIDFAASGLRTVAGNEDGNGAQTVRQNRWEPTPGALRTVRTQNHHHKSAAGGTGGWKGRV